MAKKFNKTITAPEQLKLYNECNRLWDEYQQAKKQESENFRIYCGMEGKYSIDTVADPYAGQGFRGYDYKYPNPEALAKERAERDTYYKENVKPWDERKKELLKKYDEAEEALCVALWGCGRELYHYKQDLKRAEKALAEQIADVEYLKNKIAEMEKRA